jgi:hypothetical protein
MEASMFVPAYVNVLATIISFSAQNSGGQLRHSNGPDAVEFQNLSLFQTRVLQSE